jgi:hypothetical protein
VHPECAPPGKFSHHIVELRGRHQQTEDSHQP